MKILTYDEYKNIHKKLTKTEVSFYETNFLYRTKLQKEETQNDLQNIKDELVKIKEQILGNQKEFKEEIQNIKDEIKE